MPRPRTAIRTVIRTAIRSAVRAALAAAVLLPAAAFLGARACAAELPSPVIPAGVGVTMHFTRGHEKDLDLIAAAK